MPFLGSVPLHMDIRALSDAGTPVVASDPDGSHSRIYRDIATRAWEGVQTSRATGVRRPPSIVIE